jgi:hypothetical protein
MYLEPLAIPANITQDSFCLVDQVLLSFGFFDPVAQKAIIEPGDAMEEI